MQATTRNRWAENAVRFDREYNDDSPLYSLPFVGAFVRKNLHRRRDLVFELLEQALGKLGGKIVLDIGCGVGRFSHELARRGAHAIGYDISPDAIEYAKQVAERQGLADQCSFHVADVAEAEYPDADAWIAVGLLQYLPEPKVLLERLEHVPVLVCDAERRGHWIHPLRRVYRHWLQGNPFSAWSEDELLALFPAIGEGLVVDRRNPTGFLVHTLAAR